MAEGSKILHYVQNKKTSTFKITTLSPFTLPTSPFLCHPEAATLWPKDLYLNI